MIRDQRQRSQRSFRNSLAQATQPYHRTVEAPRSRFMRNSWPTIAVREELGCATVDGQDPGISLTT